MDNTLEVNEWYYVVNGKRLGPVSKSQITELYKTEQISLFTKVWHNDMKEWQELGSVGIIEKDNFLPPPLLGNDISNTTVWFLAFAPIIGTIIEYIISGAIGAASGSLWFVTAILNSVLCIYDERKLRKAGHNTKNQLVWAIFLVPVYLFRRASLLKQRNYYAITWCIVFALVVFSPNLISQISGIADPSTVMAVKSGTLYAYPDKTIEQMVDNYFENPKYQAIVANDGNTYVNISGEIMYDSRPVNVVLQFRYYKDNSFELQALEFNGVSQDLTTYNSLMDAMYYNR